MNRKFVFIFLLVCFVVSFSGCATLWKAKVAKVSFESDPEGAMIWINGKRRGRTPKKIKLSHSKPVKVTFKKEGYKDRTYVINTKISTGWVVLDCLTGFVPVIIDSVTSDWYSLEETDIKAVLDVEKE